MTIDRSRTAPARLVPDIDAPDVGPGCMERLTNGYMMACPSCAMQLVVPVAFPGRLAPQRAYSIADGDPETLAGLTLSPSIHHPGDGCGWHGYLRGGVFVPC